MQWLLGKGQSPKSCNEALGLLKKIMQDAVLWGFCERNPIAVARRLRVPENVFSFWDVDEVRRFLAYYGQQVTPPDLFWACALVIYTGLRRGEAVALKWDCVDVSRRMLTVRRAYCLVQKKDTEYTKNKKVRRIPISPALLKLLMAMPSARGTGSSGYVLPRVTVGTMHRQLAKMARESGVKVIKFHDLRHTFASNFVMAGVRIYELQKLLGHCTVQMTERYAHLSPDHLQGATDLLDF